jgi:hypothetical protein
MHMLGESSILTTILNFTRLERTLGSFTVIKVRYINVKNLVVLAEFIFKPSKFSQFAGEFKGGEEGVFGGEADQGRTGQRLVSVDSGQGVAQVVALARTHALFASAPEKRQFLL